MKKVNLFGCTTAEKLIILENAYNEVFETLMANAKPVGVYNENTVYEYGNMVMYEGGSYIYSNETAAQGIPVSNTGYWFQISARGVNGVGISMIENDGYTDANGFTITHVKATLTDGNEEHFDVQARDGTDGQSVSDVVVGTDFQSGGYTVTPLTFYFNGTDSESVEVRAKNGDNGGTTIYRHTIITGSGTGATQFQLYTVTPQTITDWATVDNVPRISFYIRTAEGFTSILSYFNSGGSRIVKFVSGTDIIQRTLDAITNDTILKI